MEDNLRFIFFHTFAVFRRYTVIVFETFVYRLTANYGRRKKILSRFTSENSAYLPHTGSPHAWYLIYRLLSPRVWCTSSVRRRSRSIRFFFRPFHDGKKRNHY